MAGKGRVYDSKENGALRQDDGYLCWPPRWLALRDDLGGGTQQRAPNVRRSDRRPANSPTTFRTCVQLLRLAALANRLVYFSLCMTVRYPRHQIGAAHRIAPQIKGVFRNVCHIESTICGNIGACITVSQWHMKTLKSSLHCHVFVSDGGSAAG